MFQQPIERSEVGHQLPGALCADTRYPLDVVARIPHQGKDIDDLVGTRTEFLEYPGIVEPCAVISGIEYADPVAHQLEEVLVSGDDDHIHSVSHRLRGQRADDIIGFEPRMSYDRYA